MVGVGERGLKMEVDSAPRPIGVLRAFSKASSGRILRGV